MNWEETRKLIRSSAMMSTLGGGCIDAPSLEAICEGVIEETLRRAGERFMCSHFYEVREDQPPELKAPDYLKIGKCKYCGAEGIMKV